MSFEDGMNWIEEHLNGEINECPNCGSNMDPDQEKCAECDFENIRKPFEISDPHSVEIRPVYR